MCTVPWGVADTQTRMLTPPKQLHHVAEGVVGRAAGFNLRNWVANRVLGQESHARLARLLAKKSRRACGMESEATDYVRSGLASSPYTRSTRL